MRRPQDKPMKPYLIDTTSETRLKLLWRFSRYALEAGVLVWLMG
jgi:hypothetical protein